MSIYLILDHNQNRENSNVIKQLMFVEKTREIIIFNSTICLRFGNFTKFLLSFENFLSANYDEFITFSMWITCFRSKWNKVPWKLGHRRLFTTLCHLFNWISIETLFLQSFLKNFQISIFNSPFCLQLRRVIQQICRKKSQIIMKIAPLREHFTF